ncbi:hypothetical protein [Rhizobium sp. Root483D2]|uniref:hypothetical protein n=1 Tax=Rhizobium sp. Root483D2 TaxID=1736545 RepID=UPI000A716143|nr:hypothetical protein [Rhizobium sp. Root483D2]
MQDKFSIQVVDAVMLARIHRIHATETVQDAEMLGNDEAKVAAIMAIQHAETALALFREADSLLPDLQAARDAKWNGDIVLLESGSALLTARQKLGKDAS